MTRVREFGLIFLTAAVILFAAQNLSVVEVAFLFWRFPVSVALIALVPLLTGLIVGTAGTAIALKRRRRAAAEIAPAAAPDSPAPAEAETAEAEEGVGR